jgi:hypothetical protein
VNRKLGKKNPAIRKRRHGYATRGERTSGGKESMGAFDVIRFVLNILRLPTYDAGGQPLSILYPNVHPAMESDDVVFDAWEGGGLAGLVGWPIGSPGEGR